MTDTFAERVAVRISECDAEIARIARNAAAETTAVEGRKAVLQAAAVVLAKTPEAETLLTQLKQIGLIGIV